MGLSLVISLPTRRMSLGPNSIRPKLMPSAPMAMTQNGMDTESSKRPAWTVWTMAASGPTALATSLAPWANESSAAEHTSGTANSLRTDFLRFSRPWDWRRTMGTDSFQATSPTTMPMSTETPRLMWMRAEKPFRAR